MSRAFDTALNLLFAPLLVAQGIWVRLRAQRLAEPPGPRRGEVGTGAELRLLILGDSSAAGVGADHQDHALSGQLVGALAKTRHVSWRLIAETGATTRTGLGWLEGQAPERFDMAVVVFGVNDVTRGVSAASYAARQILVSDVLSRNFGVGHVLFSGVPPMAQFPLLPQPLRRILGQRAVDLDTALAESARRSDRISHIPLELPADPTMAARDGFHPSEAAYALWAGHLAAHVLEHAP